jgi:hypothetical protein
MDDRDQTRLWYRWLLVAASIVIGVGGALVVLALVGMPAVIMDLLYLPGEPDVATAETLSFAIGVTGSVMVGWGISMLYVYLDPSMIERPRIARTSSSAPSPGSRSIAQSRWRSARSSTSSATCSSWGCCCRRWPCSRAERADAADG